MQQTNNQPDKQPIEQIFNPTVAIVLGQVGCVVFFIIFISIVVGLLLDKVLDTRPLFTILLAVGSAPAMFISVLWVVRRAAPRLNPAPRGGAKTNQEV